MAEITVEIVCEQELYTFRLPENITLIKALEQSPFKDNEAVKKGLYGIFGKKMNADTILHNGDRIEIYRPLIADAKNLRRKRAET